MMKNKHFIINIKILKVFLLKEGIIKAEKIDLSICLKCKTVL